jgi:hypothetical protein
MNARNITAACALLLTTLVLSSCKDERPTPRLPEPRAKQQPQPPEVEPVEAPSPGLGEGVIARGDDVEIRVEDFADHARRAMLFAPDEALATRQQPDPRRMRTPYVHMNVTRALVASALAESEARRREIKITQEAVDAAIAQDPNLRRFAGDAIVGMDGRPLGVSLSDIGLTRADLDHAGRQIALRQALTPRLLDEVTVEDAWRSWSNAHDVVDLVVATVPNVPTSSELNAFISESSNDPRILAYFEQNTSRFADLPTVLLDVLAIPRGEPVDNERLIEAKRALDAGEALDSIASRLKLEVSTRDTFIAAEDRAAFAAADGATGISLKAPRGSYAWRVVEHVTPPPPTLDRRRKREVAAEILRTQEISPAALETLSRARDVLESAGKRSPDELVDAVQSALSSSRGARAFHTGPFTPSANMFVPKLGVNDALSRFAFGGSTDAPLSALNPPLRGDQSLIVARIIARSRPERAVFDANAQANRDAFVAQLEPRIVDIKMNEWFESHDVRLDMRPLRERYGIDRKPVPGVPDPIDAPAP